MEIQSIITKFGKPFGVMIEDAGDVYPILMKALHVPVFFDELQRSGWNLYSLPFGFKKNEVKLEDLPVLTHSEAGITEEKEQFLMDTTIGAYKEVDLKAKMVRDPVTYLKFRESTKDINTRAELLNFLLINRDSELDIDTPLTYMPLNSFVAYEALFTPEEYFDPNNAAYRKLIEDRRDMSLRSFIRTARTLVNMGLSDNYTAKQLVDAYFAWGFCGMRINPYDKKVEEKNILLGASVHSMKEEEIPYITEGILTYMSTSGEIYRPATCTGPGYKPGLSEIELETRRRELGSYGYEYVYPVLLKTVSSTQVTTYICDDITIQYDESMVLASLDGAIYTTHTIRATSPEDPAKKLSTRFFNVVNPEKRKELFTESYLNAVAHELVQRTITYADVSSYKAVLASGGGNVSAFSKILSNPEFGKDAAESLLGSDDEMTGQRLSDSQLVEQLSRGMHSFLRGDVDKSNKLYEEYQNLVDSITEGQINIDSTFSGGRMDQLAAMGNTLDILKITHKYLGVSLEEIARAAMEVTKDTAFIEFRGNEKATRINLFKRDMKRNGYIADCNEYRMQAARDAKWIHFVQEIYRELGPKGNSNPKHIAVKLLSFYRGSDDRISNQIWKYICDVYRAEIENNVNWREQTAILELIPRLASQAIFEGALKGVITFPKQISGRVMQLDVNTVNAINSCLVQQYDSTIAISETTILRDGNYYRYCVNATIMDEYVVPNKEVTIPEKPFMPMWMDLRNYPTDRKKVWIEKGYIPDYQFPGFSTIYKKVATTNIPLEVNSTNIPETVAAYVAWAEQWKNDFSREEELVAPKHYVYEIYPGLVSDDFYGEIESTKKLEQPVERHLWGIDPVILLTRDDIFKRFPGLRSYFEIVETLPPAKEGIKRFTAYSLEDFYHLSSFEHMDMAPDFGKQERPIAVRGNTVYFRDLTVNYSELETLDEDRYAVRHICGRKYIIEDINGKVWEVVI